MTQAQGAGAFSPDATSTAESVVYVTAAQVVNLIGIPMPDTGTPDRLWLEAAVGGINALAFDTVPRLRELPEGAPVPADITTGLLMQARRLWDRRSSVTGVTYTDTGPRYVARWDPDIERLLRIGSWAPPRVG